MPQIFKFQGEEAFDRHYCEAEREGEWLVFKCPDCAYERRMHSKTGEMKVRNGAEDVLHEGQYRPIAVKPGTIHSN